MLFDWSEHEMEPDEYVRLTNCKYSEMADICDRTVSYVSRWFINTHNRVEPQPRDKRLLYFAYKAKYHDLGFSSKKYDQQTL